MGGSYPLSVRGDWFEGAAAGQRAPGVLYGAVVMWPTGCLQWVVGLLGWQSLLACRLALPRDGAARVVYKFFARSTGNVWLIVCRHLVAVLDDVDA